MNKDIKFYNQRSSSRNSSSFPSSASEEEKNKPSFIRVEVVQSTDDDIVNASKKKSSKIHLDNMDQISVSQAKKKTVPKQNTVMLPNVERDSVAEAALLESPAAFDNEFHTIGANSTRFGDSLQSVIHKDVSEKEIEIFK